jgi:hypothetical protein
MLLAMDYGQILIINIKTFKIVNEYFLGNKSGLRDIKKTLRPNSYALATLKGLIFIQIIKKSNSDGYSVMEEGEVYLRGLCVRSVVEHSCDTFLVCTNESTDIYKINRVTGEERAIAQTSHTLPMCLMLLQWPH